MGFCADTLNGTIHRFPGEDEPCYCGAVIKNRRVHERIIIQPAKPDGSRTAPVLLLLERRGNLTVDEIAKELHETKTWVKRAVTVLARAHKVMRAGSMMTTDPRGCRRSVAIYGLPLQPSYPEADAASQ